MKLRLWNNTMVSCLPVKSGSGLADLPMGWPGLFSFPVCPGVCSHPGRKGNRCWCRRTTVKGFTLVTTLITDFIVNGVQPDEGVNLLPKFSPSRRARCKIPSLSASRQKVRKRGWLTGYEVWSKSRAERETHYNYAQRTGARRLNADGPA